MTNDKKERGFVKLYRDLLSHPVFTDPYLLKLFNYCLLKASHKERDYVMDNIVIHLMPGEFIWGRKVASEELNYKTPKKYIISEKTWERKLFVLEKLGIVTRKVTNKYTVINVVNWAFYQSVDTQSDQQNDQQVTSKRPTDDQQMTTDKNVLRMNKNVKDIIEYLNSQTSKSFRHNTKKTQSLINARLNEGYSVDDFRTVIDNKTSQWLNDPSNNKYLRPETLFGNKFESYLNERLVPSTNQSSDNETFNITDLLSEEDER